MNTAKMINMLKLTKAVSLRDGFTPIIGRLILNRPSCCLASNAVPNITYLTCCNKRTPAAIADGKQITPRFTRSHSSAAEGGDLLVYNGSLTIQIRLVKVFSLCSSIAGLAAQPILYNHAAELGGTAVVIGVATFVGFFTFVTPVLLHLLTKKYVTELHHNNKTGLYTASLLTFFLRVKKVTFKAEEVVVPDVPGLFTTFKVKGTPLFVDPKMFENPNHYGKLMGYDKPIDYLLKKDISSDINKGSGIQDSKK